MVIVIFWLVNKCFRILPHDGTNNQGFRFTVYRIFVSKPVFVSLAILHSNILFFVVEVEYKKRPLEHGRHCTDLTYLILQCRGQIVKTNCRICDTNCKFSQLKYEVNNWNRSYGLANKSLRFFSVDFNTAFAVQLTSF